MSPINSILLKLANTCNLNCSYCYWFKDKSVYEGNKIITQEVLDAFYIKLTRHINQYRPKSFVVTLHGGEPLLAGKQKVESIVSKLYSLGIELNTHIHILIQTNGLLLDEDWITIFKAYNVSIGLSMDGPKEIQDTLRRDLGGNPTFERTVQIIRLLQQVKCKFGILSVCNPSVSAKQLCRFFIEDLGVKTFDVLIPDANYMTTDIPKINKFFNELIQLWYTEYKQQGVNIRIAKNIVNGMLGTPILMQAIGYNSMELAMIKPNGEIEAYDNLHSLGYGFTKNTLTIFQNEIDDIRKDKIWKEAFESSLDLHIKCQSCKHKLSCGGGNIATRWSEENRFNNPSVYCEQLYDIFENSEKLVNEKQISQYTTEIIG